MLYRRPDCTRSDFRAQACLTRALALFLAAAVVLSGCSAPRAAAPQPGTPWPTKSWQVSTPQKEGMDAALLEKMQSAIRDQKLPLHSLLIIRHGVIVSETYYESYEQNTRHTLYSVTKSFIATLVGIALDQGKLKGVDQRALDLLPGKAFQDSDARKQAMTLANLLTMSSGLDWVEGDATIRQMYMSPDWVQMVMDLPMAVDPGEEFLYCSGCSHILSAALRQATGQNTLEYAQSYLFEPLGITNLAWEADRQGTSIGGWGLDLAPRDMAKLGYLYLHNGVWEGKQIVSNQWVQEATKKRIDTGGRLGYGYQWWIYDTHGAYAALGRYGQMIWVCPELDLVVVTTAQMDNHDPIFNLIDNFIIPAVKE